MVAAKSITVNDLIHKSNNKKAVPEFQIADFSGDQLSVDPLANIFIPDWENRPEDRPPVLSLNEISVLTHQNLSALIASPGFGKSSVCESIAADFLSQQGIGIAGSYMSPKVADCLGFKVWADCKGVLYIDFERTNLDVWNSFFRMCKRAGVPFGGDVSNVTLAGMRSIPRLKERLEAIEHLLQIKPVSLLILDGAGDMVTDTNDLLQAIECRIFLRELTVKYQISIFTTLHPNPNSFKPRGHIGSEICREAECVLLAKNHESGNRIITSEFDHGKNRNSAPISSGYKWSDDDNMFVSVQIGDADNSDDYKSQAKRAKVEKLAKEILPPPTSLSNKDLVSAIMQTVSKSESSAKRLLNDMIGWGILNKSEDGLYRTII